MDLVEQFVADQYADNAEARAGLLTLYREYASWSLKDSKFDQDFTSGDEDQFYGYLWEMVLARHLKRLGFEISSADKGPDFKIDHKGRTIWVEATCPAPSNLPPEWLEPANSGVASVKQMPHEKMLLRWTNAFETKKGKHDHWLKGGTVKSDQSYVIAISGCRLDRMEILTYIGISQFPFAVEAVFPVGPIQVTIDRDTLETADRRPSYRPIILKKKKVPISTTSFLNPEYADVSALLGSSAGFNAACGQRYQTVVVHNPLAKNPLPKGILGADDEFVAEDKGDYFELHPI